MGSLELDRAVLRAYTPAVVCWAAALLALMALEQLPRDAAPGPAALGLHCGGVAALLASLGLGGGSAGACGGNACRAAEREAETEKARRKAWLSFHHWCR